MNKQKLIDTAIEHLKGILPSNHHHSSHHLYFDGKNYALGIISDADRDIPELNKWSHVCSQKEFLQRSKEKGFVEQTGYKWGVEYPTNGKKADLPDDIVVMFHHLKERNKPVNKLDFTLFDWFKIVDKRYKPVEQLVVEGQDMCNKIEEKLSAVDSALSWWDYENNKPAYDGALPPVGYKVEFKYKVSDDWSKRRTCLVIAIDGGKAWLHLDGNDSSNIYNTDLFDFRPLNHAARTKELKKKRVVDAVMRFWKDCPNGPSGTFSEMYDAGFLKLPEEQ
jgi:hypothetical protein